MKISLAKTREKGFTLIEVLTVIIIIGILAAVAIPVFTSQRSRAQDSQTISDVKNIATFAETLLADRTKSITDLSQSALEYKSSANVLWDIKGNTSTGGYCISAFNRSGKTYNSTSSLLTYDSTGGGLKQSSSSCSGANSTPVPTSSTSATAAPRNPAIANLTTNWGGQTNVAPDISAGAPKTPFAGNGVPSTYAIASDANFFYVASRDAGAVYKVSKTNGATWSTLSTGLTYINSLVYLNGWLYGTNQPNSTIYRINPSTGAFTTVSGNPYSGDSTGISTDGVNTLYNREYGSGRIRALTLSSDGTSIVSSNVVWTGLVNSAHAPLYNNGYLLIISGGSLLQKNISTGEVATLATGLSTNSDYWQMVGGVDMIYAADNGNGKIVKINLNTGALTDVATGFSNTLGLATDGTSLYVSQYYAPGGLTKVG